MTSSASARQPQRQMIDAASLSLEQLVGIQRDLESEVQNLSVHLRSLRFARNKLQESREALQLFCGLDSSGKSAEKQEQGRAAAAKGEENAAGGAPEREKERREEREKEEKREGTEKEKPEEEKVGEPPGKTEDGIRIEEQLDVLVPLTGSLYVKGRLTTREKLLVDIGTGYWVEKTGEEANVRLERTSGKVNEQVTKVEKVILEKQRQAEASRTLIQQKYLQQQLLQQQLMQQGGAAGNR